MAELHDAEGGAVVRAQRAMRFVDEAHQLIGADAFLRDAGGQPLHQQGHVAGLLHQRQLGRRLAHAAAIDDGAGIADRRTQMRAQAGVHGKGDTRIQCQCMRVAFVHGLHHQRVRVLVFFPQILGNWNLQHRIQRAFFERGADQHRVTIQRKQQRDQTLACTPRHAGEITQRSAGADQQRIHAVRAHQAACAFDALLVFLRSDRRGALRPRRQLRACLFQRHPADLAAHVPAPRSALLHCPSTRRATPPGLRWRSSAGSNASGTAS